MNNLSFVWDEEKDGLNQKKHGVSFEEAKSVFFDENGFEFFDPDHSGDEDRFVVLGLSFRLRVLVVCHCCREKDSIIRIISARKATPREREYYRRRK
ncbi:MAG: BrnT family toxin [Candidatus Omnitrophica bacterium]|nr:BrnT family toxin [Candidatus Omnitrophota bacterium]MBI5023486.1 BrnT family toxin [Candidatus Omnitrophota bacterium]